MRSQTRNAVPLASAFILIGLLTACGSSTTSAPAPDTTVAASSPASSGDSTAASGSGALTISGFAFSPATVKAGQEVTVTNADGVDHTVTIAGENVDVKVPANGSATFTAPSKAGSYALTCDFHPSMSGTLTVTA